MEDIIGQYNEQVVKKDKIYNFYLFGEDQIGWKYNIIKKQIVY